MDRLCGADRMNGTWHDGTLAARILRQMASSPDGTVATTDLLPLYWRPHTWPDPVTCRQRGLTRIGNVLRRIEAAGLAERAGVTGETGWQRCPINLYRITQAGRDTIAWWDRLPSREELATQAADRIAARQRRAALIAEAAARYQGRKLSKTERRLVSQRLRKEGLTLRTIADILGVTPECVRQDNLPNRTPLGHQVKRLAWLETGPMAGLAKVTVTEW